MKEEEEDVFVPGEKVLEEEKRKRESDMSKLKFQILKERPSGGN